MKKGKPGAPIVSDEVTEICNTIIEKVDLKEVVFALSKKGAATAEEKRVVEDNKELKAAFITAKTTQIRTILQSYAPESKDTLLTELKSLNDVVDIFPEKANVEVLKMMFELGAALELHSLQIRVTTFFYFSILKNLKRIFKKNLEKF